MIEPRPPRNGAGEPGAAERGARPDNAATNGAATNGAATNGAATNGAAETGAVETGAVETGAAENGATGTTQVLYCHCKYAKVIDTEVKARVLAGLSASGIGFEAVADLCEMSARKDPALARLAAPGCTKIAACFPRAVRWLFHAAGAPLAGDGVEVLNMREQDPEVILRALVGDTA